MTSTKQKVRTAMVLSGGGTRGAYEVGVIHYIRTMLPPDLAKGLHFDIQCGSSVGAINCSYLAAMAHDPVRQGTELLRLWSTLKTENIYRSGPFTLGKLVLRSFMGILTHMMGLKGFAEPNDRSLHFQGFFDTRPFFQFLRQNCPWADISKNIDNGTIDAMAVSATNMLTGHLELFIQKRPEIQHSQRMIVHLGKISPRHVMASAALPILFPPVPIQGTYYNDGGMRLNTPLAPAVSLGAGRIMVVGTKSRQESFKDIDTQTRIKMYSHPPTLGDVLGKLYHAILLDRLDSDRDQVDRINRVLEAAQKQLSKEKYEIMCQEAGVQKIETLYISPSVRIATLVDETSRGSLRNLQAVGILEKFILRLLEADPGNSSDFLSYFLFDERYLKKLIDLGFEDARSRHDEIAAFAERSIRHAPVD